MKHNTLTKIITLALAVVLARALLLRQQDQRR